SRAAPVRRRPGVAPGRGAAAPAVGRPRTTIGYVPDQQLRAGSAPRAGCCTGERRETPAVAGSNPERWHYALEGSPSGLWHLLGKQEGLTSHASSNLALSAFGPASSPIRRGCSADLPVGSLQGRPPPTRATPERWLARLAECGRRAGFRIQCPSRGVPVRGRGRVRSGRSGRTW